MAESIPARVQISPKDDEKILRFKRAERQLAEDLEIAPERLNRGEVLREVAEGYLGGDVRGKWADEPLGNQLYQLTIQSKDEETIRRWQDLERAVARDLDAGPTDLTKTKILDEAVKAYLGE